MCDGPPFRLSVENGGPLSSAKSAGYGQKNA